VRDLARDDPRVAIGARGARARPRGARLGAADREGTGMAGMRSAVVAFGLLWLAPLPARALTIGPGQSLGVDFTFAAPPVFATGGSPGLTLPPDVLTFRILLGAATTDLTGLQAELWDGATRLGSRSGGASPLIFGFADAASRWPTALNRVDVDLTSVVDGTIQGMIRLVPTFGSGAGALEITFVEVLSGATDAVGALLVASPSPIVSAPRILPEPAAVWLLVAALAGLAAARAPRR
jgi:hypothetical protein